MAVLVQTPSSDIAPLVETFSAPPNEILREPETGLVLVRGRIGGDGAPFNMGEATVSRAAVRLATGETGFGYALGRDREKARLIALCDALIQTKTHADLVERNVLAPLRERLETRRREQAEQTAATRVDFFTMVRGEG